MKTTPPPTFEHQKLRPKHVNLQIPVGHIFRLSWYETSDTYRDSFLGYECEHCMAKPPSGAFSDGCPAFHCCLCRKWYEAPLSRAYLPGEEGARYMCLGCLRGMADRLTSQMAELISAAEKRGQ